MVYVHLAEGFEEIEAITLIDVLHRGGIKVETIAIPTKEKIAEGKGSDLMVTGAHGISVKADKSFIQANYGDCEMIVLPGGMPGTTNLQAHEGLREEILKFANEGKELAAICAAPMVFGELGLLQGRRATIYPSLEGHLKGALVSREGVVRDGNFTTSKGPATAMAFGLKLVEIFKGEKMAMDLGKAMLLE